MAPNQRDFLDKVKFVLPTFLGAVGKAAGESASQSRLHMINNHLWAQCVILVKIQALEQLPRCIATAITTNLFCISLAFEDVNWLIIAIHIQERKLIKEGRCRISRHIHSCVVCPSSLLELLEYLGSWGQRDRECVPPSVTLTKVDF